MRKYILALVPAILACNLASAEEQVSNDGIFYGNGFAGFAVFGNGTVDVAANDSGDADFDIESGYSAGLLLGYDFGTFRVEGEFSHVSGDIDGLETNSGDVDVDSDYESNSLMINGLMDFEFDSAPITLSVGLGIGASQVEYSTMENSGIVAVDAVDETVLICQGIIRGGYAFSENATLGLSYRYVVTDGISSSGSVSTGASLEESDIDFDSVGVSLFEIFFSYDF
jgi:opacity protein-like surface antigen